MSLNSRSSDIIVLSDEEDTDGPNSKRKLAVNTASIKQPTIKQPTITKAQPKKVDTNFIREKLLEEEKKLNVLKALKKIQKQDTPTTPNGRVTAFTNTHSIATVPIQGSALNKSSAKSRMSTFEHSQRSSQSKIVVVPGNLRPSLNTVTTVTSSGMGTGISSRLQQLVDNVAVDQALPSDRNLSRLASSLVKTKSYNPPVPSLTTIATGSKYTKSTSKPPHEMVTIFTPSRFQPPPLLSAAKSGSIQVSTISSTTGSKNLAILALSKAEMNDSDKQYVKLAVETSKRYRDFMLRQTHNRRAFSKQLERQILVAPYPKTFRQVWPIIPVQDPSFIPNFGLEGVVEHFQSSARSHAPKAPPKVKPVCNQCKCDFASAWQIRKGNSKQLLLCESCDFQNLKILQRSKLSTQLKTLLESVRKEEDQHNEECEKSKKEVIELEKKSLLSLGNKPPPLMSEQKDPNRVITTNVIKNSTKVSVLEKHMVIKTAAAANGNSSESQHPVIPSILGQRYHTPELLPIDEIIKGSRKRKETSSALPPSKSFKPGSALDQTLNKLSETLIKRKLDEHIRPVVHEQSPKVNTVIEAVATPTSPVSMEKMNSFESRKNRRKGTPKHKRLLSSSSGTGE